MKQMVVYIITKLELGGAQKVCLSLFQDVIADGHRSIVISGFDGLLVEEARSIGPTILLPELKREIAGWSDVKAFLALFRKLKLLRKSYPDMIVHTHSSKAGILGRWAAWLVGCRKIVHTVHGYPFNDFQPWYIRYMYRFLEFLTAFVTTKFVCVSKSDKDYGKKNLPKFSGKLIRAAVDAEKFVRPCPRLRLGSDPVVIGSIGCFKPQKNLLHLVRAFGAMRDSLPCEKRDSVRLDLVGDGEMRFAIESLVEEMGLEQVVRLDGWSRDISSKLASWDVFAMSSLWEGLPCAVIEARLSRLPVVAYSSGGISEVVHSGKNGFVVELGNWRALAARLLLVVLDERLRNSFAMWRDDLGDFSRESMYLRHRSMYEELG